MILIKLLNRINVKLWNNRATSNLNSWIEISQVDRKKRIICKRIIVEGISLILERSKIGSIETLEIDWKKQ